MVSAFESGIKFTGVSQLMQRHAWFNRMEIPRNLGVSGYPSYAPAPDPGPRTGFALPGSIRYNF